MQPCELFDTDSEKRSGSKLTNAGRLSSQSPQRPCVQYVRVQDPSEGSTSLGSFACLSEGGRRLISPSLVVQVFE